VIFGLILIALMLVVLQVSMLLEFCEFVGNCVNGTILNFRVLLISFTCNLLGLERIIFDIRNINESKFRVRVRFGYRGSVFEIRYRFG
jgi:hypothetical protein